MTFNDTLILLIKDNFKRNNIEITDETISKRRKEILSKSKIFIFTLSLFNLTALVTTQTELKLIARAAIIWLNFNPQTL